MKFRRQHAVAGYIADFYCHEAELIVEVDGEVHATRSQVAHDENRDSNLAALGYRLLRFTNRQILEDPASVLEQILRAVRPWSLS